MSESDVPLESAAPSHADRRDFLARTSTAAMAGGLAAGYGTLLVMAGQFLYPAEEETTGWRFVTTIDRLPLGESMAFVAPSGVEVVVARQGETDTAEAFIALSSVCPHLGCQVHWEPQNDRFFCPCHNGAFDSQGNPTEGPPAQANQTLTRFPLRVENGLLFVEVPLTKVGGSVAIVEQPDRQKPQRV